ncbi:MAG TPA: hypothetical protein VFF66_04055 [Brevundimonas sp.]|nr:hypothetical protein [Brevundimonas sp.]
MERVIVEPLASGWAVRSDALDNLMVFRSGSAAERAGRDLALGLAAAGEPAELQLRLKDGSKAARFVCLPPTEWDPEPLVVGVRPPPRPRPETRTAGLALATA